MNELVQQKQRIPSVIFCELIKMENSFNWNIAKPKCICTHGEKRERKQ